MKILSIILFTTLSIAASGQPLKTIVANQKILAVVIDAKFNFSATANAVSGWTNLIGAPATAVVTGTDATSGVSCSTVATANWMPYASTNSSGNGNSVSGNNYFTGGVMGAQFFQWESGSNTATYNAAKPQFEFSGLNTSSTFTVKVAGSFSIGFDADPTHITVAGSTTYTAQDYNANASSDAGVSFTSVVPDSNGKIRVFANSVLGSSILPVVSGIEIITN